jgi:hypothetical protein
VRPLIVGTLLSIALGAGCAAPKKFRIGGDHQLWKAGVDGKYHHEGDVAPSAPLSEWQRIRIAPDEALVEHGTGYSRSVTMRFPRHWNMTHEVHHGDHGEVVYSGWHTERGNNPPRCEAYAATRWLHDRMFDGDARIVTELEVIVAELEVDDVYFRVIEQEGHGYATTTLQRRIGNAHIELWCFGHLRDIGDDPLIAIASATLD